MPLPLGQHLKQLQVLLVAAAGAAAAVPGMAALGRFQIPGGAETFAEFVLAAFSAAAVLGVYVARDQLGQLPAKAVVALAATGMLLVLVLFFLYVWLSSVVLVSFEWGDEPQSQFVPLFLPETADSLIRAAGSRAQFLEAHGPDSLRGYRPETSVAATLVVLLLVYTALVTSLALVFGVLGSRALKPDGAEGHPLETPPDS